MKTSTEILTHYQCESCDQRWTIGDAPEMAHMYCPRCGNKQLIEDVPEAYAIHSEYDDDIIGYTTDPQGVREADPSDVLKKISMQEYEAAMENLDGELDD